MPASYDRCVRLAKGKRSVRNPYAYCSKILVRSRVKRRRGSWR
jgi:hypothetical protein